jgi:hypothetical protein
MRNSNEKCLSAKDSNADTHDRESVINVEGIPFTKEVLMNLKTWIIPLGTWDRSGINTDIDSLNEVESFIFDNCGSPNGGDDKNILHLLSFIHCLKEQLKELADLHLLLEEGGES